MSLAQSLRHIAEVSAVDECCSWEDLAPVISQRVIDRIAMPAIEFGSTSSAHMGAATRPISATSSGAGGLRVPLASGAGRPGVIGRDISVPRHDHKPVTGRWRWEELEMRIANHESKQQENEVDAASHEPGGVASTSSSRKSRRKGIRARGLQMGTPIRLGNAGQRRMTSASSQRSTELRDSSRQRRSSYDATVERLFEHTRKTQRLPVAASG